MNQNIENRAENPQNIEKATQDLLDMVGDPAEDPLGFYSRLNRHSSIATTLAAGGSIAAIIALAKIAHWGYKKLEHHHEQNLHFNSALLVTRRLLFRGGEIGKALFLDELEEILVGDSLDQKRKIKFLKALEKDEPIDNVLGRTGGVGAYKHNADNAITGRLSVIKERVGNPELKLHIGDTLDTLVQKTNDWVKTHQ